MFFHRIERIKNSESGKATIAVALDGPDYTIIPLVRPQCAVGKYLMDPQCCAALGKYSGERINIFYASKQMEAEFDRFMDHILFEVRTISGEEIKKSGLLVFFPQKKNIVTIEAVVEDDYRKFRSVMYNVIEALQSPDALSNITCLQHKIKITPIDEKNSPLIQELHTHVVKFFV